MVVAAALVLDLVAVADRLGFRRWVLGVRGSGFKIHDIGALRLAKPSGFPSHYR